MHEACCDFRGQVRMVHRLSAADFFDARPSPTLTCPRGTRSCYPALRGRAIALAKIYRCPPWDIYRAFTAPRDNRAQCQRR